MSSAGSRYVVLASARNEGEGFVDGADRGRDVSVLVLVEREGRTGPDVWHDGQVLHHCDARRLVLRRPVRLGRLSVRLLQHREQLRVAEAELRRVLAEVNVQEVGRVGEVGDPAEQEELVLARLDAGT